MGIFASHKHRKKEIHARFPLIFYRAPFRRKVPLNETFPNVPQVLLCHPWRGKENQRNRQLHTPTPRESGKIPELPLHFEYAIP